MTKWDNGRCQSFLEEVQGEARRTLESFPFSSEEDLDVGAILRQVQGMVMTLKKVKTLLERERKSRG